MKRYWLAAIAILVLLIAAVWIALLWSTHTPGTSFRGSLPPATESETTLAARLRRHVETIAATERNVGENPAALEAAAVYLERELQRLGYQVESQRYQADSQTVRNLAVTLAPPNSTPDTPTIIVGAHYDSFEGSPGANDNATGTAALLELARNLADLQGKTPVRLRLVFFTNEEPPYFQTGLMGSVQYANALAKAGERVVAMYSLETLGFYSDKPGSQNYPPPLGFLYPGQGDFVAFVSMTPSRRLLRESIKRFRETTKFPSEGGSAPGFIPGIDWSDHWAFERLNYPAIMITDTAYFRYPYYHKAEDTPDKVDFDKLARITIGVEKLIREKAATAP